MSYKRKSNNRKGLIPFFVLGIALIAVLVAIFKYKEPDGEVVTSSSTSSSTSAPSSSEESDPLLTLTDEEVYNLDLMAANGVEPIDTSQYASVGEVIDATMTEFGIEESQISLFYEDFQSEESYGINEDVYQTAASTIKVPLAVLFVDAIEAGDMSWDTAVTYTYANYEEGDGTVTAGVSNGTGKFSYTIEELIGEALMHSDNTATNMLISYYNTYYGTGAFKNNVAAIEGVDTIDQAMYSDNVLSAKLLSAYYDLIASNEEYQPLVEFLLNTSPDRLFTTYVKSSLMANKYGNYSTALNDAGIYYENDQPQYSLVVLTDGLGEGTAFLENLNLRINQYYRSQYM